MTKCENCGRELEIFIPNEEWGKNIRFLFLLCPICGNMHPFKRVE